MYVCMYDIARLEDNYSVMLTHHQNKDSTKCSAVSCSKIFALLMWHMQMYQCVSLDAWTSSHTHIVQMKPKNQIRFGPINMVTLANNDALTFG